MKELDAQIALEVLKDPIPLTNEEMRDFGLGMGNGYVGDYKSPGKAWVLDWNPEYFKVEDALFSKWPKFVYRGGREDRTAEEWKADQKRISEDPEFQREYEEYKKLLPAAWRPREFSSRLTAAMWAFNRYNEGRRDLSFTLSHFPNGEWNSTWEAVVSNYWASGEDKVEGVGEADTAEEALCLALLDHARKEAA